MRLILESLSPEAPHIFVTLCCNDDVTYNLECVAEIGRNYISRTLERRSVGPMTCRAVVYDDLPSMAEELLVGGVWIT